MAMSSAATANTGNEVRNWTLDEMSAGSMSLPELLQEPLILATKTCARSWLQDLVAESPVSREVP
jgi:hypothetical protein